MSSSDAKTYEVHFSSNEVRLSLREWAIAAAILAVVFVFTPVLWQKAEPIEPGLDIRVPYSLGNDYWMHTRYGRLACAEDKCLAIGDSVIWGHYVASDQTLPAHLNKLAGTGRFANLGLDGIHPAAMTGLVEYYGGAIAHRKVLLHCNLLWMSSKRADLQDKKASLNHAALVPQFYPAIPCYSEPLSGRIGVAIGRGVPFFAWARHLQIAYFDSLDVPKWTTEHPYACPFSAVTLALPSPDELPSPPPVAEPWTKSGLFEKTDAAWVELETSIQWQSFQRVVDILKRRGNQVFVLVGPFNEYMLTDKSRQTYRKRLDYVQSWLEAQQLPHFVARLLPSDDYADTSHPLAEGYAKLARQVMDSDEFKSFLAQ
jgi:hypothetical protein